MLLDFRRPKVAIVEKVVSQSGKYLCFLGNHYHKGHTCWVYGCSNKETGEIIMHHYNTSIPGCLNPKAQCETDWRPFREKMIEKPKSEVTDDAHIERPWEKETIRRGGRLIDALKRRNQRVN